MYLLHQVSHHGHSHAHSHIHSAPKNISSVAWMVICGDGIHNLADGFVYFTFVLPDPTMFPPPQTCHWRSFCCWLHVRPIHQCGGPLPWASPWDRRLCHAHQGRDDNQASHILQRPLLHPGHGWHGFWPPGRRLPPASHPVALLSHSGDFPLCGVGGYDARAVLRTCAPHI